MFSGPQWYVFECKYYNLKTWADMTSNYHHSYNATLRRIPPNAMNNKMRQALTAGATAALREAQTGSYLSYQLYASSLGFTRFAGSTNYSGKEWE